MDLVILQLLTYATSYNMLPAVRDLDVPVVLVNVQKKKAPDYANTDTATWLGELYACGAVGEMVADLERAGKRHAVITGVVEGGDPEVEAEIADWCKAAQVRRRFRDTNMRTRFTCGAREFCNKWSEAGPTHHMAAASGRHIDTILKVAKIFNVPVDVITR